MTKNGTARVNPNAKLSLTPRTVVSCAVGLSSRHPAVKSHTHNHCFPSIVPPESLFTSLHSTIPPSRFLPLSLQKTNSLPLRWGEYCYIGLLLQYIAPHFLNSFYPGELSKSLRACLDTTVPFCSPIQMALFLPF